MSFNKKSLFGFCGLLVCAGVMTASHAEEFFVGGSWACNFGKVRLIPPVTPGNWKITIDQTGSTLILGDESGNQSAGRLFDSDTISASNWKYGKQGYLGINIDGTFYRYKDAVQSFNVRADTDWNFIRWDGGVLCVRPK
jgi:hypothetical protein